MVWKPHTTVAAIIERDNTFLMVEELIDKEKVFNQPAGHLEDNESLIEAVIREVKEETAWAFTPQSVLGIYRWQHPSKGHTHMRTTFIGSVSDHDATQKLDFPIINAIWCTRAELLTKNLRNPMVLQCIDDYLSGMSYPLELLKNG